MFFFLDNKVSYQKNWAKKGKELIKKNEEFANL
jgi:hypothetical protein